MVRFSSAHTSLTPPSLHAPRLGLLEGRSTGAAAGAPHARAQPAGGAGPLSPPHEEAPGSDAPARLTPTATTTTHGGSGAGAHAASPSSGGLPAPAGARPPPGPSLAEGGDLPGGGPMLASPRGAGAGTTEGSGMSQQPSGQLDFGASSIGYDIAGLFDRSSLSARQAP